MNLRYCAQPLSRDEQRHLAMLFDKYRDPLQRYLRSFVRSRADIPELVQEAFCRLAQHAGHVRDESAARSYLFQIATNLARDLFRRHRSRHVRAHIPLEDCAESLASADLLEHALMSAESLEHLHSSIERLPPKLRVVVELSRLQNKRHAEIAALLGVGVRTVERRVGQALQRLTRTRALILDPTFNRGPAPRTH